MSNSRENTFLTQKASGLINRFSFM